MAEYHKAKPAEIVVMDEETATRDPQMGDYLRIEGFIIHEMAEDLEGTYYMIVEKVQ